MFYRAFRIFFHIFTIFYCVSGENLTRKKNEKRILSRNNYQMCLDSFDIHRDMIIRAHESRNMGAKYLNVIDVNSREECLKVCCQMEGCDVFTFEEKKPGNCYLFQCGPLHDFKCKFINYANYSSAVQTGYNSQSNTQLEKDIRISQQEHELKSLRKLPEPAEVVYPFTESPVKLIATLAPKLLLTTSQTNRQVCSRNQYECRSSGDCIAVYNVCDGIPQCADGSDEAADLACPTEKPTIASSLVQGLQPAPPPVPVDVMKYQQMVDERKPLPPIYAPVPDINPKPWELPNLAHQVMPPQQPFLYPAQQMEVPQIHKGFGAPGYQWNYQPIYEPNKEIYNPVNSFRDQNNLNPYEHEQSHIFNHKGPGVIGEKETDSSYLDLRHPYMSHFASSNRGAWQDNQQSFPSPSSLPKVQPKQVDEIEKNVISTTTPACDTPVKPKDTSTKSRHVEKVNELTERRVVHEEESTPNIVKQSTLKHEAPKINHVQVKESKEHSKDLIVIKGHNKEHGRNTIVAEHLKQTNENENLRPRGAVISLALGLIIMSLTATLIACRLRVVRRRGRRHGPYAHDADYLVNGMYL